MKFCEECGMRLDILNCPSCSHENPRDFKFCEECGQALAEPVQPAKTTKNKTEKVAKPAAPPTAPPIHAPPVQEHPEPKRTAPRQKRRTSPSVATQTIKQRRPRSQRAYQPVPAAPPKPSILKTIFSLFFQSAVRFLGSAAAGYALGKAGFLIRDLLLPFF
ncbi:MAG: zinc ribbon domain-containing protein [Anaerolineae bacterium]|nr:zinc ribbon domain-containing protein [Anaerolineae bacterium]